MVDPKEATGEENIVRKKYSGVSIDNIITTEARAKYDEVMGKFGFMMLSFVSLDNGQVKDIDSLVLSEGNAEGAVLLNNPERLERFKDFIKAMGGEVLD